MSKYREFCSAHAGTFYTSLAAVNGLSLSALHARGDLIQHPALSAFIAFGLLACCAATVILNIPARYSYAQA